MNISTAKTDRFFSERYLYIAGKVLLVIALSKTQIAGTYPLGIAYSAVLAEENAIMAAIGLIAGALSSGGTALKYISAGILYALMLYIRRFEEKQVKAVALGTSVIIASLGILFKSGVTPSRLAMMLPEAFAVGGLYILFGNIKKGGMTAYCAEIILAGGFLSGIYGLRLPYLNINIAVFAMMLIVMSTSYSCGIPISVLTGAVLGFMTFIQRPVCVEMSGLFAVSALISAVLSKTGKTGVSAGFLTGMTVCILSIGSIGELSVADVFSAPIIFLILPQKTAVKIGSIINENFKGEAYGTEILSRIKTVAQAVEDLGTGVRILSKNKRDEREICADIEERVCRGCKNRAFCFEINRDSTEENVKKLRKVMERDGFLDFSNAPQDFRQACVREDRFLSEFSHMLELEKQNEVYSGEIVSDRELVAKQYGEISNIISNLSEAVAEKETDAMYSVSVSVCQEAKRGQEINGDTAMHFQRGNKYFVILCDGMGSGKAASEISGLTAQLFSEFLNSGINKSLAVDMINSALALNADRESFSSADILEIDLRNGTAEFLKVGSAQSFLKHGNETEEVSSSALPVGILEKIEVKPQQYQLSDGDEILMVTDGIGEAGSGVLKNEWIKKLLQSGSKNGEEKVKSIVQGAKTRAVFSDDMTAVVIKIKEV